MTDSVLPAGPAAGGGPAGAFALGVAWRAALLFAAMTAPFALFDRNTAAAVAFGVAALFMIWRLAVQVLRGRRAPKQPWRIQLLVAVYGSAPAILSMAALLLATLLWTLLAYDPAVLSPKLRNEGLVAAGIVAALFALFVAVLGVAPRLARPDGGAASRLLAGMRRRGSGPLHGFWLGSIAWSVGLMGVLFAGIELSLLHPLELWRDHDRVVTIGELASTWPILPLGLACAAVMLAMSWRLEPGRTAEGDMLRNYLDDVPPPPAPHRAGVAVAVVAGFALNLVALLGIHHLYLVTKQGRAAMQGLSPALEALAARPGVGDMSLASRIDEMNRLGFWSPDRPDRGLGSLVEDPASMFSESCTLRLAVALADAPQGEAESTEIIDRLRMCVAITCAAPVAWAADPVLMLVSSRPSRAAGWRDHGYVGASAAGSAPSPGGDCNADGTLAADYQG